MKTAESTKVKGLAAAVALWASVLMIGAASAGEIKVFAGNAMREPMSELLPQFERTTGHKVVMSYNPTNIIMDQIRAGRKADLILAGREAVVALGKQGKVVPGTMLDVSSTGVGLAVRSGAPKPDISTVDAFKQTMLKGGTVAVAKVGLSGEHFMRVVDKLGIAEQMKPKIMLLPGSVRTAEMVAQGKADMAVQLITELKAVKGVEVVGTLPAGIENNIITTAGVFTDAAEPEAAKALVKFLSAPAAAPVLTKFGMSPM